MSQLMYYYRALLRTMQVQAAELKDAGSNLYDATKTYVLMLSKTGTDDEKNAPKYIAGKYKIFNA